MTRGGAHRRGAVDRARPLRAGGQGRLNALPTPRMTPRPILLVLALLGIALLPPPAAAQETAESPNTDGGGPELTFGGLVQTQFNTTSQGGPEPTELALRRVRLSANARLGPRLSGRIQAELANAAVGGSAELNEAYALLELSPAVGVLVGKGGRPFGAIDATPAARLTPIERGARFRGADAAELYGVLEALAYAGRSVGVQVLGDVEGLPVGLAYAAGYFTGSTGEEGTDADIRQVAARVQVAPVPGLAVGLAATNRAFGRDAPPDLGPDGAVGARPTGETRRGSAFAVDVALGDYGEPGLHGLLELAAGTLDPFTDDTFRAAQGWLAYRAPVGRGVLAAVEPMVRVGAASAQGPLSRADGVLVTPGLNLYGRGNARLALNLDAFFPSADGADALVAFRSQVQIEF